MFFPPRPVLGKSIELVCSKEEQRFPWSEQGCRGAGVRGPWRSTGAGMDPLRREQMWFLLRGSVRLC